MADLVLPADLAVWDPLGGTAEPVMTGHDGICIHTMAGTFTGTDAWFHQDGWGGTESTVGVAGSGFAKQWTPWNRQADANLEGNARWLSIECADVGESFSGSSDEEPPLTDAQIDRIIRLCVFWCDVRNHQVCPSTWTCHQVGIPPRFIANSCERGIGTHYHGIEGRGLVPGCPRWSSSTGKICPRMVRHRQVRDRVVPEVARRLTGGFMADLTEDEQREILLGVRDIVPKVRAMADPNHAQSAVRAPGYFAKLTGTGSSGTVYYVDSGHQSKLAMPIGGAVHNWLKTLHAVAGFNDRAIELDQVVLDGIPPAG